jgi:hypothetical protein
MDVLQVVIAHSAQALRAPPPSSLPPPPHSAAVFDALALLAQLASASPALLAAVHARVPSLAADGATARAKRDTLRLIHAHLAAPEHGVAGVFGPPEIRNDGGLDNFTEAINSAFDRASSKTLGRSLSALEAADMPPSVSIVSEPVIDQTFQTVLRACGLELFDTTAAYNTAFNIAMQRRGGLASLGFHPGNDANAGSTPSLDADDSDEPAYVAGPSFWYDLICGAAIARTITEDTYNRSMALYARVLENLRFVDADLEPFVPQLQPDAPSAWRAFGAYVARSLACEPMARGRALRDGVDANSAATALATMLRGASMVPAALPFPPNIADLVETMQRMQCTTHYIKDVDLILRGTFPCKARDGDSLVFALHSDRMTQLLDLAEERQHAA